MTEPAIDMTDPASSGRAARARRTPLDRARAARCWLRSTCGSTGDPVGARHQNVTKIEINFTHTGAGGAASHLELALTGGPAAICRLRASDCNGNGNGSSCLLLFGGGTSSFDWSTSALVATHLTFTPASTCRARVGVNMSPIATAAALAPNELDRLRDPVNQR